MWDEGFPPKHLILFFHFHTNTGIVRSYMIGCFEGTRLPLTQSIRKHMSVFECSPVLFREWRKFIKGERADYPRCTAHRRNKYGNTIYGYTKRPR